MAEDAPVLPGLSPVGGKPLPVAFDAGRPTSAGGVPADLLGRRVLNCAQNESIISSL
jgi:hypothetical protein